MGIRQLPAACALVLAFTACTETNPDRLFEAEDGSALGPGGRVGDGGISGDAGGEGGRPGRDASDGESNTP